MAELLRATSIHSRDRHGRTTNESTSHRNVGTRAWGSAYHYGGANCCLSSSCSTGDAEIPNHPTHKLTRANISKIGGQNCEGERETRCIYKFIEGEQEKFQEEIHSTLTSFKPTETLQGEVVKPSPEFRFGQGRLRSFVDEEGGSGVGSGRFVDVGIGSGRGGANGSGRGLEIGGNSSQIHTGGPNWRFKKLDLPTFEGVNPDGWILRAERYFKFYRLTEEEQVEAAVVSLDGAALLWYQWEHGRRPIHRWEELKGMLLRQFRPTSAGSLHEQWLDHYQTTDVVEYRRRFIELMGATGEHS
ncbi:hypothetical protein AgCh_031837 [Apium graveolens]